MNHTIWALNNLHIIFNRCQLTHMTLNGLLTSYLHHVARHRIVTAAMLSTVQDHPCQWTCQKTRMNFMWWTRFFCFVTIHKFHRQTDRKALQYHALHYMQSHGKKRTMMMLISLLASLSLPQACGQTKCLLFATGYLKPFCRLFVCICDTDTVQCD